MAADTAQAVTSVNVRGVVEESAFFGNPINIGCGLFFITVTGHILGSLGVHNQKNYVLL